MNHPIDMRGHLSSYNGSDKSHEAMRIAQFPSPDRLHDHHEGVVDLIVQLLRSQLAAQVEADPLGKERVQLFQAVGFSRSDALDQIGPSRIDLTRFFGYYFH
jgi:hypothetical protein